MAAIESTKMIQKYIGLETFGPDQLRRYFRVLVPICVSIVWILFGLSLAVGVFLNKNENFGKTSISISGVFGSCINLTIYWHLLVNCERIYSLLDDMQDIANDNCK